VTVVRNAADDLDRTCRSLEPFAGRFTHVVMDGASDDETLVVAGQWAGVLGSEVYSEPDNGPYEAMNKALDLIDPASFVWFMNAGDRIPDSPAFDAVDDWLEHGSGVWCFGKVRMVLPYSSVSRVPQQGAFSRTRYAYSRMHICHQSVVAQSDALRKLGGFSDAYPVFADFNLLLRLSAVAEPSQLDVTLSEYNLGGLSSRHPWRNHLEQAAARRTGLELGGVKLLADYLYLCGCLGSFGLKTAVGHLRRIAGFAGSGRRTVL